MINSSMLYKKFIILFFGILLSLIFYSLPSCMNKAESTEDIEEKEAAVLSEATPIEYTPETQPLARIKTGGRYAFIDLKGNYALDNARFDDAWDFTENLAGVKVKDKWGYIDKMGNFVVEPQFDWAGYFSEGAGAVDIGEKTTYIDKEGNFIMEPQELEIVGPFSYGLAPVKIGCFFHYIDKTGKIVIKHNFDDVWNFQ